MLESISTPAVVHPASSIVSLTVIGFPMEQPTAFTRRIHRVRRTRRSASSVTTALLKVEPSTRPESDPTPPD
jgi:hypothetical protein